MKYTDVLSYAINGIQRELKDARKALRKAEEEVASLELDLEDLVAMDNETATLDKGEIGRPAGFTPEPLINHDRK